MKKTFFLLIFIIACFLCYSQDTLDIESLKSASFLDYSSKENNSMGKTVLAKRQIEMKDSIIKQMFPVGKVYCMPTSCPVFLMSGWSDRLHIKCLYGDYNLSMFYLEFYNEQFENRNITNPSNYSSIDNVEIMQENMDQPLYCVFEVIETKFYPFWNKKGIWSKDFSGIIPVKIIRVYPIDPNK